MADVVSGYIILLLLLLFSIRPEAVVVYDWKRQEERDWKGEEEGMEGMEGMEEMRPVLEGKKEKDCKEDGLRETQIFCKATGGRGV